LEILLGAKNSQIYTNFFLNPRFSFKKLVEKKSEIKTLHQAHWEFWNIVRWPGFSKKNKQRRNQVVINKSLFSGVPSCIRGPFVCISLVNSHSVKP
jgi:hypothetical protein